MKNLVEYLVNEAKYSGKIEKYSKCINTMYDALNEEVDKNLDIDLTIGGMDLSKFKGNAIKRSIGHILESYVLAVLLNYKRPDGVNEYFEVDQTNNDTHDAKITFRSWLNGDETMNLEVKAYTGSTDNINFTEKQRKNTSNTVYLFVKYTYSTSIHIEDILLGTFEDIQSNGKLTRHGGKTRNMVSMKQDKDNK